MEAETQIEQAGAPVKPPQAESAESKSKRGGKRPGAGRKPNLAKRLLKGFSRDAILEAAGNIDDGAVIAGLLKSKREKTRLETLVFVRDSVLGRPAQSLNVSAGLMPCAYSLAPIIDAVRRRDGAAGRNQQKTARSARPERRAEWPTKSNRIKHSNPNGTSVISCRQ